MKLEMTLPGSIKCIAELPSAAAAPFQPCGEAISLTHAILAEGKRERLTFTEQFIQCCRDIGVSRGFLFNGSDGLIAQFTDEDLEPLQPGCITFASQSGCGFVDDCHATGERYFVQHFHAEGCKCMVVLSARCFVDRASAFETVLPICGLHFMTLFREEHANMLGARWFR
jgi:hypothetical protein